MNQVFTFENQEVRTIYHEDEPYWVLTDVCKVLNLTTPSRVAERLDEDEVSLTHTIDALGRTQEVTIVNESGLYSVILKSRKKQAKAFKRWITHEVLPEIRKTGSYGTNYQKKSSSAGEVASLLKIIIPAMKAQGSSKEDIVKQIQLTCNQFGIQTISNLVKAPTYKQLTIAIVDDE